jgi:hypothetical protein
MSGRTQIGAFPQLRLAVVRRVFIARKPDFFGSRSPLGSTDLPAFAHPVCGQHRQNRVPANPLGPLSARCIPDASMQTT